MANSVFEYRGVDNLVYSKVLIDTKEQFVTGEVKPLSPVAQIGRTTTTSSEAHYYDNQPMIIITAAGADELTLTVAPLDLQTYAEITGQAFDSTTGSLIECEPIPEDFAIGYRTKGTDGKYRYVWRYKGKFTIPDETSQTESDSIDTNNTELTWTGVSTVHKFTKTKKRAKAMVCDERFNATDLDVFFDEVLTPDTIQSTTTGHKLSDPVIFPSSTTFDDTIYISLVCDDGLAEIRYTTDGSDPSGVGSTAYTEPFSISATTTIKAQAVMNGYAGSNVVSKTFAKEV